jgi:hypothetical protein
MKKTKLVLSIVLAGLLLLPANIFAQDEEPDNRPVREPWSGGLLGDQQTIKSPYKGCLELIIHHRFGTMQNGLKDLYGIYAPSNIRLGLDYGITEKLMVGIGTEKNNKLQEVHVKYNIFNQTRSGSMPVALSYYGNFSIDAGMNEADYEDFTFTNRLNYFHQLIISRKFSDRLSIQLAPSFAHFNGVDREWHNDYFGISAGGRLKAFGEFSIIAQYSQGFGTNALDGIFNAEESDVEYQSPKPNVLLGFEIGTPTHTFQLFAANYDKITPQKNFGFNTNDFMEGEILVGMNVIVRF